MPQQKHFTADPDSANQIKTMFELAQSLVLDGWGATVKANPQGATMTTNAPNAIIEFHLDRMATIAQSEA